MAYATDLACNKQWCSLWPVLPHIQYLEALYPTSSSSELSSSFTLIEHPIKITQYLTTSEVKRTSSIFIVGRRRCVRHSVHSHGTLALLSVPISRAWLGFSRRWSMNNNAEGGADGKNMRYFGTRELFKVHIQVVDKPVGSALRRGERMSMATVPCRLDVLEVIKRYGAINSCVWLVSTNTVQSRFPGGGTSLVGTLVWAGHE